MGSSPQIIRVVFHDSYQHLYYHLHALTPLQNQAACPERNALDSYCKKATAKCALCGYILNGPVKFLLSIWDIFKLRPDNVLTDF